MTPRGRTPVPTESDLELWRRLIAQAFGAARRPSADAAPLERAAGRAIRAIMPVDHQDRGAAFDRLIREADAFAALSRASRGVHDINLGAAEALEAAAMALLAVARECQAILAAPADRRTRARADIDD